MIDPQKLAAVAEVAQQTLGCKAIVMIAIDDSDAQGVIGHGPSPSMTTHYALTCALGYIYMAQAKLPEEG